MGRSPATHRVLGRRRETRRRSETRRAAVGPRLIPSLRRLSRCRDAPRVGLHFVPLCAAENAASGSGVVCPHDAPPCVPSRRIGTLTVEPARGHRLVRGTHVARPLREQASTTPREVAPRALLLVRAPRPACQEKQRTGRHAPNRRRRGRVATMAKRRARTTHNFRLSIMFPR